MNRNGILLRLHTLAKDLPLLHRFGQQIALDFFLPLFSWLVKFYHPGIAIHPRHSVLESQGYDIFMSDIDLTLIVKNENEIRPLLSIFKKLKRLFPFLGEPEVLTSDEWEELQSVWSPEAELLWKRIFNIRKISWQRTRRLATTDEYERQKIDRGLARSFAALKSEGGKVFLDELAPDHLLTTLTEGDLDHSNYLEANISHDLQSQSLLSYRDKRKALTFLQLCPGYPAVDEEIKRSPIYKFILLKEIYSTLCFCRLKGGEIDETSQLWIHELRSCVD